MWLFLSSKNMSELRRFGTVSQRFVLGKNKGKYHMFTKAPADLSPAQNILNNSGNIILGRGYRFGRGFGKQFSRSGFPGGSDS